VKGKLVVPTHKRRRNNFQHPKKKKNLFMSENQFTDRINIDIAKDMVRYAIHLDGKSNVVSAIIIGKDKNITNMPKMD
jgi:hypothetical protein